MKPVFCSELASDLLPLLTLALMNTYVFRSAGWACQSGRGEVASRELPCPKLYSGNKKKKMVGRLGPVYECESEVDDEEEKKEEKENGDDSKLCLRCQIAARIS